jgi:penicillin-binding protein 2
VLRLDGHNILYGRCWVESRFGAMLRERGMTAAHHPIPFPHVGHDGNADGFLTYADALERSCNVFFETAADRLGIERLSACYEKFGLGRPTGIGIGEVKGRLPRDFPVSIPALRRSTGFFGGIGQGWLAATPIQMANAVAMIARDGIWMRPMLLVPGPDGKLPSLRAGQWQNIPERVDLHLPPAALKAAKLGMYNVVNGRAGTGKALVAGDAMLAELHIAGKTGTAQAARFSVKERDAAGQIVLDASKHPKRYFIEPSTPGHPNPAAPWYRAPDPEGHDLNHAWYIGFAPMNKPKVAFAVMVEYGGSGGVAAASIAREALEACVNRHYLTAPIPVSPIGPQASAEVH